MNRLSRNFSSTVLAACWAVRLIAQAPVTEHIDVQVSNIDVIVTDGLGHFVHGLTRDDFAVYDGRKPQHLTNFTEYSGETTAPARAPDHASAPAAPTIENPRFTVLILVDHLHLRPATRARAVSAVARFVTAHAGTNIVYLLGSYDGTLHLYPPAADASDVARAVSAISRKAVSSLQMERERRQMLEVMQTETDASRVYRSVLDYAELERHNMEETLVALDDAITAIAGADGPKRLLYISDGLPQTAAPEMFRYYDQRFHTNSAMDVLSFDASRSWERIAAHANAVGVTMYMLQASGAASEELAPVDTPTLDTKLDLTTIRYNKRGVLQYLADETGGRAIVDTNELDVPLAGLVDEFFNYYSLGYRTPSPANGPHSVAVRINRHGLHLRYRRSYNIRSPNEALADAVQTLFYLPRTNNPLNADLSIGGPKPAGRQRWVVPIVITVPHVNLLAGGTVTCFLAVMNAAGDHTSVKSLTVPVGERADLVQSINLTVGPGEQVLAAAVRDDLTTITTFLRQNFAAGH